MPKKKNHNYESSVGSDSLAFLLTRLIDLEFLERPRLRLTSDPHIEDRMYLKLLVGQT